MGQDTRNNHDDKIIRTTPVDLPLNIRGFGEEVYKAMIKHKTKIAQIDAESGESETFAIMLEKCVRVAVNLKRLGITPDDILTPCTDNHLNTAVIFIAIMLTGAKVASVDPFAADDERVELLSLIKPKMMFCSENALQRARNMVETLKLNTKIVVFGKSNEFMSFDELLVPRLDQEKVFSPYIPQNLLETVMIVFTSGTTGVSHAVCEPNYALLALTFSHGVKFPAEGKEQSRILMYPSLAWVSGVINICINTIQGNVRIVASSFTPEMTWRYIQRYKVSDVMLISPDVLALISSDRPSDLDVSSLKLIMTGAAPISGESVRKVKAQFPGVLLLVGYGQAELGGGGTSILFDDNNNLINTKSESIGLPVNGVEIKIVDPDTEDILGPNQIGEFRVKSKRNMNGYYNEDSTAYFDSDGFVKTGDLMYYDEDGYFYYVERLKEVLRYNKRAIYPSQLEKVLNEYPGVELAIVVGIPSDGGDLPIGVIVTQDKNIMEDQLQLFLSKRVDDRSRLYGGIRFVDRSYIPFTPSRKVQRRKLRAQVAEDLNKIS